MPKTNAGVLINGLAELQELLRNLPEALWREGEVIVVSEAMAAYHEMDAATPEVSSNLRGRLTIDTSTSGRGRPRAQVKNRAPHAWLWEHGSKGARTGPFGWGNTGTGVMPAANKYIPAAIRHREAMRDKLIAMVERFGLKVQP